MIIDCHVHAGKIGEHYPEWWVKELYRVWGGVDQWTGGKKDLGVGERLVAQMDAHGIDKMCVMTSDHRRVYGRVKGPYTPNEFLREVREAAPDRFALTCSVDPLRDVYEATLEVERCIRGEGFDACKIYPSYDHFDPRDERLFPLYEKFIELDIAVQIHMGWTPCMNAPMKYQHPHLLDDVALRYPEMKMVVCHLGWPWVDECMALIAKYDNIHADLAYWGWFTPEENLRVIQRFGRLCGFDKLLFGSENSHTHMAVELMLGLSDEAARLGGGIEAISPDDLDKVMWKNTARLWKIDA